MSKTEAPAAPDYSPIYNAQIAASNQQSALAKEQFEWAKQAYADNKGDTDEIIASMMETQRRNDTNAQADRKRYEEIYQPLEGALAADARTYSSDAKRDLESGRAQATVGQGFEAARANATRDLESFGINPGSTRYAALDIGTRAQEGAAKAAAGNQASQMVDATGRALRSEAINVGRGYPGQIAGTYNTALQAGTGANNANLATTASGGQTMGTAPGYYGSAASSLTGAAGTMNTQFGNQMTQYNANQAPSPLGQALGMAAGIGAKAFFAADGGAIGGMDDLDQDGGPIPRQASPSRGVNVDDVEANLNVGEFVMPKDAVLWHGQKAMYAMITKAKEGREEAKQTTGAVPQLKRRPQALQVA